MAAAGRIKLRRVGQGFYESPDKRYSVHGFYAPANGGYPGGWRWYWRDEVANRGGSDHFYSKREAVEALHAYTGENYTVDAYQRAIDSRHGKPLAI